MNYSKTLLLIAFCLFSQTIVVKGFQTPQPEILKSSDVDHFYLMLEKEVFVSDLSNALREELVRRSAENPSYISNLKTIINSIPFSPIDPNDYSSTDLGKGRYFTFDTQESYYQFIDFVSVNNNQKELVNYRNALIQTGSKDQNLRFLQAELSLAVRNYNNGNFRTSRLQFQELINAYGNQFNDLDDIYFLKGESNFGLKNYREAIEDYKQVLTKYSGNSSYTNLAIYRILFLDYVYNQKDELLINWEKYKSYITSQNEIYYNILVLIAVVNHQFEEYNRVINLLGNIPQDYPGYLMSNYIIGNSYANLDDVDNAIRFYTRIEKTTLWPWSPRLHNYIKTSSLLQLGYLHYLKGLNLLRSGFNNSNDPKALNPNDYFNIAKNYFNQIDRKHPEYSSAVLSEVWIDLQNANYTTATLKIQNYIKSVNNQDLIYQAVFLDGYTKQKRNPSEVSLAEDSYFYVMNGMVAHQFLTDFLENRRVFNRQLLRTKEYIDTRSIPSNSLPVAQTLLETMENIVGKLGVSNKLKFSKDNQIFSDDIFDELSEEMVQLNKNRDAVRSRGLRDLTIFADSATFVLKNIIANKNADPISKDVVLFAQHSTLIFQVNENTNLKTNNDYRLIAENELKRIMFNKAEVDKAIKAKSDVTRLPVLEFYSFLLDNLVRKYNSIEVVLLEGDFYRQQSEIERWGDASAYGLTALLYQELERRKSENLEFLTLKNTIKNSINRKRDQLERYLSDVSKIEAQRNFVNRIDSINNDFHKKLTDYRSVFFNPISEKELSSEQLKKLEVEKDEPKPTPPPASTGKPTQAPKGSSTKANPPSSGSKLPQKSN